MPDLKEQMRIARVNRMKKRAADAWHRAHCEKCMAGAGFVSVIGARAGEEESLAAAIAKRFGLANPNLSH